MDARRGQEPDADSPEDLAEFRAYVASRLEGLVLAFSDPELLAQSVDGSTAESRAFHGYLAMRLDEVRRAFSAVDVREAQPHRET